MARARRPDKTYGQLTKRNRDRLIRAAAEFHLSPEQARRRFNRGTWSPFARDLNKRVPSEYRREAVELAPGVMGVDWKALAYQNMERVYGDYFKWNEAEVKRNLDRASPELLHIIATASPEELDAYAFVQEEDTDDAVPGALTKDDIGYYVTGQKSGKPEWINIFWYH